MTEQDNDFASIGRLVAKGQELLDIIKGGGIRKMELAFENLKTSVNSEWLAIRNKMNNEALAAIARVDTETVRAEMGFTAQNYNGDFMDTHKFEANKHGHKNEFPLSMGVREGRNDCFKVEMIPVHNGDEPALRHPEAQALLDFMGIGRGTQHFSQSFNIMKMTVLDTAFLEMNAYDFYIPNQHIKRCPTATFMAYTKIEGDAQVAWLGSDTEGSWKHVVSHQKSTLPGSYTHVDLIFTAASVGDVIYLAVPTICTGLWPVSKKHPVLYSPKTELIRKVDRLHTV